MHVGESPILAMILLSSATFYTLDHAVGLGKVRQKGAPGERLVATDSPYEAVSLSPEDSPGKSEAAFDSDVKDGFVKIFVRLDTKLNFKAPP
ncbi:uncharacterized protein F5147DRAFT_726715 [Suillus discolor]|uniref:Uncharacterized protein n=1 Tax=Suillus discolor TaxID=1912936 RepID=A0A9P7ESJ9_9AGAM|nr:uncharacterized protein F5147DRAFT_726715 [Suillus discolor]KAG2088666.1 hypothetical protein F5147DRAFT_726715 [Suillus discolor]